MTTDPIPTWEPAPSDMRYPVLYCCCEDCMKAWPDLPTDEMIDRAIGLCRTGSRPGVDEVTP